MKIIKKGQTDPVYSA